MFRLISEDEFKRTFYEMEQVNERLMDEWLQDPNKKLYLAVIDRVYQGGEICKADRHQS